MNFLLIAIISEQILNIMRNITVDEMNTQLLFDHADAGSIIEELTAALNSHSEDVIVQVNDFDYSTLIQLIYSLCRRSP